MKITFYTSFFFLFLSLLSKAQDSNHADLSELTEKTITSEIEAQQYFETFFDTEIESKYETITSFNEEDNITEVKNFFKLVIHPSDKVNESDPLSVGTNVFYAYSLSMSDSVLQSLDAIKIDVIQYTENFLEDKWEFEIEPTTFIGIQSKLDIAKGFFNEVMENQNFQYNALSSTLLKSDQMKTNRDNLIEKFGLHNSYIFRYTKALELTLENGQAVKGMSISFIEIFENDSIQCNLYFEINSDSIKILGIDYSML